MRTKIQITDGNYIVWREDGTSPTVTVMNDDETESIDESTLPVKGTAPSQGGRRWMGHPVRRMSRSASVSSELSRPYDDSKMNINDTLILNVGGTRHEVAQSTLRRIPGTKLADVEHKFIQYYRKTQGDYFFDRHPGIFNSILNFYRTGELHMPQDTCGPAFKHELDFWGLSEQDIQECCWIRYNSDLDTKQSLRLFDDTFNNLHNSDESSLTGVKSSWQRVRNKVWLFLDDPTSSKTAKVYSTFSFLLILLSISVFAAETHPTLRQAMTAEDYARYYRVNTSDIYDDWYDDGGSSGDVGNKMPNATKFMIDPDLGQPVEILVLLDNILMGIFSAELVIRFIFCPKKLKFFINWLNILDFLSILPFYIEIIVENISQQEAYRHSFVDALFILKILRIFRIFRLLRHYKGLQVLALTMKYSWKELLFLTVLLLLTMVVFASLIYFTNRNDVFLSIPHSLWWAIVTMSTVGYGDMYPTTDGGYVVGALCAVSGVLVIAFTVPSIVNNFLLFYTHVQYRRVTRPQQIALDEHSSVFGKWRNTSISSIESSKQNGQTVMRA